MQIKIYFLFSKKNILFIKKDSHTSINIQVTNF